MTDKYEIIKEEFNTNTGETLVTINTAIGSFTGVTILDDIDTMYPSLYQGSNIALAKALKKFAKANIKILKREIKMLNNIIKEIFIYDKTVNTKGHTMKVLFSKLKEIKKELKIWERKLELTGLSAETRVRERDKIIQGYMSRQEKNN